VRPGAHPSSEAYAAPPPSDRELVERVARRFIADLRNLLALRRREAEAGELRVEQLLKVAMISSSGRFRNDTPASVMTS
jgi:hypothetical protein